MWYFPGVLLGLEGMSSGLELPRAELREDELEALAREPGVVEKVQVLYGRTLRDLLRCK